MQWFIIKFECLVSSIPDILNVVLMLSVAGRV